MNRKALLSCFVVCLLALGLGLACDSASPVAPTGTLLSISATPSQISANGTSSIRVTALRANGTPVNPGTIIRLSSSLGTIESQVETDEAGEAQATLRGTGDFGTATVTARSGPAESVTTEVTVGDVATSVSLQATPSQVSATGGSVTLLAVVRNNDGEPLEGATVNFQTEAGRLRSGGSIVRTDANGEAQDRLTVEQEDLDALTGLSFGVSVVVGAGDGTQSANTTIRVASCVPVVNFTATNLGENRVRVTNNTSGDTPDNPVSYEWDFENDGTPDRFVRNPAPYEYDSPGTYDILLRASNICGSDEDSVRVTVTADPL